MPFEYQRLDIQDVILITPKIFGDERGFFMETYEKMGFEKFGISREFVQDNHSKSSDNVLRGLHFQREPFSQAKLVRCVKGEFFDVAVDLRKDSPTFGKHVSVLLTEENKNILFVPRGFAHGFMSLKNPTEIMYKADNVYSPENEGGILWNDPDLGIQWPSQNPLLSEKDKKWPGLKEFSRQA